MSYLLRTDGSYDGRSPEALDRSSVRGLDDAKRRPADDAGLILLVDARPLLGECLGKGISSGLNQQLSLHGSVETVIRDKEAAALIVLCDPGHAPPSILHLQISTLVGAFPNVPVVVLADMDDNLERIRVCVSSGARGYVPTSLSLDVAIEAIRLVKAGGTYIPLNSVMLPSPTAYNGASQSNGTALLTERQTAVIEALRRGKANKIIAYELNMKESTVKVHVRNIMKKLNAKNRTEVAFLASEMFGD